MLKATIYDKEEGILYCCLFDNIVDLKYHLAVRNINIDSVLIIQEISKPIICRRRGQHP